MRDVHSLNSGLNMCTVCGGMEVHVSNIPEGLDKNQLLEYFQSQEHGGSYMTDIAYPLRNNEAVLLYKHHKGVELLSQNKHYLKNNQLTFKVLPRPVFVSMTATLDPDVTNLLLKNDKYIRELTSIPRVRFGIDKRTSLYGLEGTWYSLECAKVLLEKMQESDMESDSPNKTKDNLNENLDMQRDGKEGEARSPQHYHREDHPGGEHRQGHAPGDTRGPEDNNEDGMKIESTEVGGGSGRGGGIEFDSPMHRRAYMKLARERFLSTFYQPEKSVCDEYHYPDSQWEVYKKEGRMRNLSTRSNRDDSQERDKQRAAYDGGSSKCGDVERPYSELNHLQKSHTGWAKQGEDQEMSPCHRSTQLWPEVKSRGDARNYSPDRYHEKRGSETAPGSERRSSQHIYKGPVSCEKDSDAPQKHCYSHSCKDGVSSLDRRDNAHDLPRRSTDDRDCDATPNSSSQRQHTSQHWESVKERVEKGGYIVRDSGDVHCDDKDMPDTPHKTRRRSKNRKDHRGSVSNEGRCDSLSPNRDQSHEPGEGIRSKNSYRRDSSDVYDDCSGRRGSRPLCDKKDSIGENHRDLLDPTWLPVEKGSGHRRGGSPDESCDNSPSPHRGSCRDGSSDAKDRKSGNQESIDTNQSWYFRRGGSNLEYSNQGYSSPRRQGVDSTDSGHCQFLRQHHSSEEKRSGRRSPLLRHRHSGHEDSAEFSSSQSRQQHGSHDDPSDTKTKLREKQRHSSNEDTKSTRQRQSSEEQADGIDSPVHHSRGRRRKPKRQNPPRNSSTQRDRSQKECSGNNQCGDNDDEVASEARSKSTIPRCVGFRDKDLQFLANFALHFQGGVSVVVVCENITNIDTTVLVSPTNQLLQNTGGIAQAISHAAGPDFDKMCREISMKNGLLDVSNIVCTRAGGLLRANYVIHVSAPFYNDYADIRQCHSALVHSYINCINYANGKLKARSIAFPPISTAETIGYPQASGFTLADCDDSSYDGSFGVDFDLSINAFYDALLIYTSDENTPKLLKDIRLVINDRDSVTFAIIILNQLNSMDSKRVTEAALERYKYSYKKQTKKVRPTKKSSSETKCSDTKARKSNFEKDSQLEPPEPAEANKVMALSSPRRSPSYTQAMCQLENGCLAKNETKTGCNQKSNSLNFRKKGEYKIDEESPDGITSCLSALIHQTKTTLGAIRETNLDRKRSSSVGSIVRNRIQSSVVGGSDMDVRVGAGLARSSSCQLEKEGKNNGISSSDVGKGSKDATKGSKSASSSASGTPSKSQQATSVKQALLSTTQKVHSTDSSTPRSGFQPPKDMGGGTSSSGGQEKESKSGSLRGEKNKKESEKTLRKEGERLKKDGEKGKSENEKGKKDVDYDMRATNHIAALFEMEREVCTVCKEKMVQREELCCGHSLCKRCYREITKRKPICPICGTVYAPLTGDQPRNGKMSVTLEHKLKLPGYETANGTIVINYTIPDGIQEACHPNPGKRYHGTCRTAYLPNNRDGNEVLKLLQRAFESRLTFTVGQSQTTGRKNVVTWTDINHKTSPCGGPANCGYPDATYLQQVRAQLERKGIK